MAYITHNDTKHIKAYNIPTELTKCLLWNRTGVRQVNEKISSEQKERQSLPSRFCWNFEFVSLCVCMRWIVTRLITPVQMGPFVCITIKELFRCFPKRENLAECVALTFVLFESVRVSIFSIFLDDL